MKLAFLLFGLSLLAVGLATIVIMGFSTAAIGGPFWEGVTIGVVVFFGGVAVIWAGKVFSS